MKLNKAHIFITVVFIGLFAFNSAYAIRVDFLNKATGLQRPPLNISGNVKSNVGQNQNNLSPAGAIPSQVNGVVENNLPSNKLSSKNIYPSYNYLWWIVVFVILVVAAAVGLKAIKKKMIEATK